MMERSLAEYLVNSIWQVPLLAAAAWFAIRIARPVPRVQHRIWVGLLPLMLAMPLLTLRATSASQPAASVPTAVPAESAAGVDDSQTPFAAPATPLTDVPDVSLANKTFSSVPEPAIDSHPSPEHPSWRPMRNLTLTPSATRSLIAIYFAIIAFMAFRLISSWWAARRLVARSVPSTLSIPASELLDRCCAQLGVRRPRVLFSQQVSGPMLVGAVLPSLLLPEAFQTLLDNPSLAADRNLEAVWLHELAHLRRRDYLANLLCRIIALPLDYHPATHAVQLRIRRTREMVCDELAAAAMQSPLHYARCLVGLARDMQPGNPTAAYAIGMFEGGILEERIMQLIQAKPATSLLTRTARLAAALAMVLAMLAAPAIFHVTPTLAQTAAPATTGIATPAATGVAVPPSDSIPATAPEPAPAQSASAAKSAEHAAAAAQKSEIKEKAAETKLAKVESKTESAALSVQTEEAQKQAEDARKQMEDSRRQMEDARKRLDDAAKAWGDAAVKAEAEGNAEAAKQQVEAARRELDQATQAWNSAVANTVGSRLRDQQFRIRSAELNAQVAAMSKVDSQVFANLQEKINSPEFKQQIAIAQAKVNSPEFKAQMENLAKRMADAQARYNSPDFKQHMQDLNKELTDAQAKFNSPEFKEHLKELNKQAADAQAKFNSPEFQEHLKELNTQIVNAQVKYNPQFQNVQIFNTQKPGFLGSQLDEVRRQIDDALRVWSEVESTPAK